mgnify:CR=1 FL=1
MTESMRDPLAAMSVYTWKQETAHAKNMLFRGSDHFSISVPMSSSVAFLLLVKKHSNPCLGLYSKKEDLAVSGDEEEDDDDDWLIILYSAQLLVLFSSEKR